MPLPKCGQPNRTLWAFILINIWVACLISYRCILVQQKKEGLNQREIDKIFDMRGNSLKKWHKAKVNFDETEERKAPYKSWSQGGWCQSEGHRKAPHSRAKGNAKRKYYNLTIFLKSTLLRLTDILETFFFHLGVKFTGLSKWLKTIKPKHMYLDFVSTESQTKNKENKINKNAIMWLLMWDI